MFCHEYWLSGKCQQLIPKIRHSWVSGRTGMQHQELTGSWLGRAVNS